MNYQIYSDRLKVQIVGLRPPYQLAAQCGAADLELSCHLCVGSPLRERGGDQFHLFVRSE
jgi:hypothetical protein